jgi:hypothetical protein
MRRTVWWRGCRESSAALTVSFFTLSGVLAACGETNEGKPDGASGAGASGGSQAGGTSGGSGGNDASGARGGNSGNTASVGGGAGDSGAAAAGSSSGEGATGGEDTAAGASGESGSGSSDAGAAGDDGGCGASALSACDDGNPCTEDSLTADCSCVHDTLPDDTTCDDGAVCTIDDHCAGGICRGEPRSSTPELRGSAYSFGSGPDVATVVSFVSEERALFATGRTLTLVEIEDETLRPLARTTMNTAVAADQPGSMIWMLQPRTWLLPLPDDHIAVVGAYWGIDLYSIEGDEFAPSERYAFSAGENAPRDAVSVGNRIFTCMSARVLGYSIDPTTFEPIPGPTLTLPTSHSCHGLAVSPDGQVLYAATAGGLDRIDITDGAGSMALIDSSFGDHYLLDVRVNGDNLATYEIVDNFAGAGTVRAFSAETLEPLAEFESTAGEEGRMIAGFALLDGSQLLLQWLSRDEQCGLQTAELFELGSGDAEKVGEFTTLDACNTVYDRPELNTVSFGTLVEIEPIHELFRVDPESHALSPLRGLEQGSFERVRPLDGSRVVLHGPGTRALLDLDDPDAPLVEEALLESPVTSESLRFEVTPDSALSLLTVSDVLETAAGPRGSLLWADGEGLPDAEGFVTNDDADALWQAAGAYAYSLSTPDESALRLRRFPAAGLTDSAAQAWSSDIDAVVTADIPEESVGRSGVRFSVDSATGDVAVLDRRSDSRSLLSWFVRDGHAYEHERTLDLGEEFFGDLLVAADSAVAISETSLRMFSRDGDERTTTFTEFDAFRLLSLDDDSVYLGVYFNDTARNPGVVVLGTDDLREIARYVTPDEVKSLAFSGEHVVFGQSGAVSVATPACRAE